MQLDCLYLFLPIFFARISFPPTNEPYSDATWRQAQVQRQSLCWPLVTSRHERAERTRTFSDRLIFSSPSIEPEYTLILAFGGMSAHLEIMNAQLQDLQVCPRENLHKRATLSSSILAHIGGLARIMARLTQVYATNPTRAPSPQHLDNLKNMNRQFMSQTGQVLDALEECQCMVRTEMAQGYRHLDPFLAERLQASLDILRPMTHYLVSLRSWSRGWDLQVPTSFTTVGEAEHICGLLDMSRRPS